MQSACVVAKEREARRAFTTIAAAQSKRGDFQKEKRTCCISATSAFGLQRAVWILCHVLAAKHFSYQPTQFGDLRLAHLVWHKMRSQEYSDPVISTNSKWCTVFPLSFGEKLFIVFPVAASVADNKRRLVLGNRSAKHFDSLGSNLLLIFLPLTKQRCEFPLTTIWRRNRQ